MGEDESLKVANAREIAKKASEAKEISAFPDVAETPSQPSQVPVPYPNVAESSDVSKGTKAVKTDGKPIMTEKSSFGTSSGDEPSTKNESEIETAGRDDIIEIETDNIIEIETLKKGLRRIGNNLKTFTDKIIEIETLHVKKFGIPLWLWSILIIIFMIALGMLASAPPIPIEPLE
jgi:hypothetical protein